jgi:hypothetical protein
MTQTSLLRPVGQMSVHNLPSSSLLIRIAFFRPLLYSIENLSSLCIVSS